MRAIGIIRVSRDHDGHSPEQQARAMLKLAADKGWTLSPDDLLNENDIRGGNVSGGADLSKRPGLGPAVEAVERGEAQIIVAERLDRLFRDLDIQRAVVNRVEAAGGRFETVQGHLSHLTAEDELQANLNGSVAQYARRTAMERSRAAVAIAVERGKVPWPIVPAGYVKGGDGVLAPDDATAEHIARAFQMRSEGASILAVQKYLNSHGVSYGYHGVTKMLKSRTYLGELHHGKLVNLAAHEPIVSLDLFNAVQRMVLIKGRMAKSERLLARQRVLRCGTCGSLMTVNTSGDGTFPVYRCPPANPCGHKVTISAVKAEEATTKAVKAALADAEGHASAEANSRAAQEALATAQSALDGAIGAFTGLDTEPAVIARIRALKEVRDIAQAKVDQTRPSTNLAINASADWDRLSLDARRDLIRATVERVVVRPGRAEDRIAVHLFRGNLSGE